MSSTQLLSVCVWLLVFLVGIVAFFAKRLLAQNDEAQKAAAAANAALAQANTVLSQQVETLTGSLHTNSEETKALRAELASLLRAFTAWDKWIYGEALQGSFKTPPPDLIAPAKL